MPRLLLFIFSIISIPSIGQQKEVDSLKNILGEERSPDERIKLFNELSFYLWHSDPTEAMIFSDSAYNLIPKVTDVHEIIEAYANKGIKAYTVGNYDEAEKFYLKAIHLAEENKIYKSQIYLYYITMLKRRGQYLKVIDLTDSLLNHTPTVSPEHADFMFSLIDALIKVGELMRAKTLLEDTSFGKPKGKMARYYYLYGKLLSIEGLYQTSIQKLREGLSLYKEEGDIFGEAQSSLELGTAYLSISKYDSSRLYLERAKNIYEDADYDFGIAQAQYQLGSLYSELGDYDLAAKHYYTAIEIFENQQNLDELSVILYDLGWLAKQQGDREEALDLVNKSIEISKKVGNIRNEATGYNYLGLILFETEKYEEALLNFQKAYDMRSSIGYKKGMSAAKFNMGLVYEEMGLYKSALEMYLSSYETDKELGSKLGLAIGENILGKLYTQLGQYDKAEQMLLSARETISELETKTELVSNYLYSAALYEKINNPERALSFYKRYIALKDSVFNESRSEQIQELAARYKLNAKEREIELLNENRQQELALREQTIYNQRLLIIGITIGIILLVILLFLAFRLLRTRERVNKELSLLNIELHDKQEEITAQSEELREAHNQILSINQELENKVEGRTRELLAAHKELDMFFYKSSHDFRRPLTTFLGLSEVAEATLKDPEALNLFKQVRITAEHLDKLVKKLQAVSLVGSDTLEKEEVDLKELVHEVIKDYETLTEQKHIEFRYKVCVENIRSNSLLLKTCIENLVENAVVFSKYYTEDPYVFISAHKEEKNVIITVEDNGIGIEEKYQSRIFEMYYRANERSHGNGLGLYIVKKAVERLKGHISYKSEYGKGSSFIITMPETLA